MRDRSFVRVLLVGLWIAGIGLAAAATGQSGTAIPEGPPGRGVAPGQSDTPQASRAATVRADADSPVQQQSPSWVTYRFFFLHLANLDQVADEQEAVGNETAANGWRSYEQRAAGLTDEQNTVLKQVANECNRAVRSQDERIRAVLAAFGEQHSGPLRQFRPLETRLAAPPDTTQLLNDRMRLIEGSIDQLRSRLGPDAFAVLDGYVKKSFESTAGTVPAKTMRAESGSTDVGPGPLDPGPIEPDPKGTGPTDVGPIGTIQPLPLLVLTSMHILSHTTVQNDQAVAECGTQMAGGTSGSYPSVGAACTFYHGASAVQSFPCPDNTPDAVCMQTFSTSQGDIYSTKGSHYFNMYFEPTGVHCSGFPAYYDPFHYGQPLVGFVLPDFQEAGDIYSFALGPPICWTNTGLSLGYTHSNPITAMDLTISPAGQEVLPGQTLQFGARISPSSVSQAFTWSMAPPVVGSISTGGLYTAPANNTLSGSATAVVKACSVAYPTVCATNAFPVPQVTIDIHGESPMWARQGATQTLGVNVQGPRNSPDVTWTLIGKGELVAAGFSASYTVPDPVIIAVDTAAIQACVKDLVPPMCATFNVKLVPSVIIGGINPLAWPAGQHDPNPRVAVTITGTGFGASPTVKLSDPTVVFNQTVANNTTITGTASTPLMGLKTVAVTVTSGDGLPLSASTNVTITPPTLGITISPKTVTLQEGQTQQFTAVPSCRTGGNAPCAEQPLVGWSIVRGTISTGGLYRATASIATQTTDTVTVCAVWNATLSACDTATVTLPPTVVTVTPVSVGLSGCSTRQFSAQVTGNPVTSVVWSVSPILGSIDSLGLYTAPCPVSGSVPVAVTVKACSTIDGARCGTAAVTLTPDADNADFVTQTPPAPRMTAASTATVSVTMKNTGTTNWTAAAGYWLGSQNPPDNMNWGISRVMLPAGLVVKPGDQTTFTFSITAPADTLHSYNFQWRMSHTTTVGFGAFTPNVSVLPGPRPVAPQIGGYPVQRRGPTSGGTTVVITGANFVVGAKAYFGGLLAQSTTVDNASQITTVTPAHPAGVVDISVTNPDGQSATLPNGFTFSGPSVSSVAPASGPMAGGTPVTITGMDFGAGASVSIGGTAATGVTVVNATTITATTSAHACGTVNVVVTNTDGLGGTLANGFFYTSPQPPAGLSPNGTVFPNTTTSVTLSWGAVSGATQYAVRVQDLTDGTIRDPRNNCPTNTIQLCVNGVPTTTYTVPVQAGHSYTWWVHAGSACGQYSLQTNGAFSVTAAFAAPTPTAINPTSGPMAGGTVVTISGTGFRAGATVSIGGAAATGVTVVSAASITATTPAHACGTVNVVVTNTDGQSGTLTNVFSYTSPQPPTGLSPNGTVLPGSTTSVTLSWAAVSGATQYAVRVQDNTDGTLRDPRNNCGTNTIYLCVGPVLATTYSVPVQAGHSYTWWVHAGSACGQYSVQTNGSFSVRLPAPTVTAISPTSGPDTGGTSVTISGTGFRSGAGVTFGGVAAAGVSVPSGAQIAATAPAHAAGTVNVVVTNSDGQSVTLFNGFTYNLSIPPPPTGLSPNGTTLPGTATSVTMFWSSTAGATKYAVRLQDNTDGTIRDPRNNCPTNTIDLCVNDIVSTSYSVPVRAGHSYTWWVHAGNAAGYSSPTYASFSVAVDPLHAPTGLAKDPSSRNLLWTPPNNLTVADAVTYDLWIYGGANCASGCFYHPAAPSWYTMGAEISTGTYTWTLKANSVSRPSSGAVSGPSFTMP